MQVLVAGGIRAAKPLLGQQKKAGTTVPESKFSQDVELLSLNTNEGKVPQPDPSTNNNDNVSTGASKLLTDTYSYKPVEDLLLQKDPSSSSKTLLAGTNATSRNFLSKETIWLGICFAGIMASFVIYGLLLEYTTSGGRHLHELSFLFVTSMVYTLTAAAGRYVRDETPSTIPPARFALLGITSMGSTFCSVRSLRYVIYPIQVLAKSCKPVPVMLMGALMGKKYSLKKYINVFFIVLGVGLFTGGGKISSNKTSTAVNDDSNNYQIFGILLLFISLCFDGGTGAYEDKLMSVHHVGPFDLMYNIQLGKTILAGVALLVLNQVHIFVEMCTEMGFLLVALGLSGALGQVFIFVTISKFGALTCSIIGLARKVATLCASIYFYGHVLNKTQVLGLIICIGSMVANFGGKKGHHGGGGHGNHEQSGPLTPKALYRDQETNNGDGNKDNKSETEHDADDNDEEKPLIIGQKNVEMTTITL